MNGVTQSALRIVPASIREVTSDRESLASGEIESPGTISELHTLYSRRLYRTIITITRNAADAEDALQETFLRAHVGLRAFEGRSTVYSWLTRIAINCALMVLRKRRARPEVSFISPMDEPSGGLTHEVRDSAPTPDQIFHLLHRDAALRHAVSHLDVGLRLPIKMRLETGSSIKEIGVALNISPNAAKTRLHRARVRLSSKCAEV